jgi:hypothetical protein
VTANHEYAAGGSHTVVLTVTDHGDATGTDSQVVTVSSAGGGSTMHVSDLDGSTSVKGRSGKWEVLIIVTIYDENKSAVANATVTGTWSGAKTGSISGVTGSDGTVTLSTGNMDGGTEVTFAVNDVTHDTLNYDAAANHDPEDDSDGTIITVLKP